MDDPRLSKEIEIRDRHALEGDRDDQGPAQAIADTDLDDCFALRSSGNIARDILLPNPDLEQARAQLAIWIRQTLAEQGLSTREAEAKTGISHSEFSRINNLKLKRFTLDRLFLIFWKLKPDMEVRLDLREAGKMERIEFGVR